MPTKQRRERQQLAAATQPAGQTTTATQSRPKSRSKSRGRPLSRTIQAQPQSGGNTTWNISTGMSEISRVMGNLEGSIRYCFLSAGQNEVKTVQQFVTNELRHLQSRLNALATEARTARSVTTSA